MKAALRIARKDLRQALRDRSFFVLGFIAPLAIMAVFNFTIGDALTGTFNPRIRLVDEAGLGGADIVAGLGDAGFENVELLSSADEARRQVDDGEADAAVIFPADLARSMQDPSQPGRAIVVVTPDSELSAGIARSIANSSTAAARTIRAAGVVAVEQGSPPVQPDVLETAVIVVDQPAGSRVLADSTYFSVTMTAFFVFFTAQAAIATIHRERRNETLARILVAPIPRWSALAGKAFAAMATGFVSFMVLWLASVVLFGARWGPPLGVVAIAFAAMVAAIGLASLISTFTRTEESAGQLIGVTTTALAFLGGAFIQLPATGLLGVASQFSPFHWIVDAVGENAGIGTAADVAPAVGVILLFGLLPGAVALARGEHVLGGG